MAEIRQATILIRDRQISGGALPSGALMAEPFVNLYDGVLRFSGVTGGSFESSNVASVFEVGSTLYNSKITNRLNINDNLIISGDTGIISTYEGTNSLVGKFLSGGTGGMVLADISDISGSVAGNEGDVQFNGSGTHAADGAFNFNDTTNTLRSTNFSATTMSAGTSIFSAGTSLETIIYDIASNVSGVHTFVQPGANIATGGTVSEPIVSVVDSPSFNNISFSGLATGGNTSFVDMSATTLYSGSTNLEDIFLTSGDVSGSTVSEGSNISVNNVGLDYEVSLVASPSIDTLSASGSVITNGTIYSGGTIVDDGVFIIDAVTQVEVDSDLLPTAHLTYDLGAVGQRWDRVFARKIRLGTSSTILEDNLFSSTTGTFLFDFADDLKIDNNVIPNVHNSYDLGLTGTRWKTIYAQDLDLAGALTTSGLTDSSLTVGRVVYAGVGGALTDESGFEYDDVNNLFKAGKIQIGNPGDTGTTTTIFGDIVVIGESISGFTSELYIEDNLIELNYNPSATTISTSLGAGWSIQDGSGVDGTNVLWDIRGIATGLANRSFATNLQDIRIRETGTVSNPNGVRVIAEGDVIDGGSY